MFTTPAHKTIIYQLPGTDVRKLLIRRYLYHVVTFKTKSPPNQSSKSSLAVFTIPQNSFYVLVPFSCFLNRRTRTEVSRDSETFVFNIIGSSSWWIGSFCTVLLRHKSISVLLHEAPQTEKYRATHKVGASCLGATTSHSVAFTAEPQAVFPRLVRDKSASNWALYNEPPVSYCMRDWFIWQTHSQRYVTK